MQPVGFSSLWSTRLCSTLMGKPIEKSKYVDLFEWLQANGAYINEKLELRESSQGDGYGAFVSQPVGEGELLFEIPRSQCLTLEDAISDESCGNSFSKIIEKAGPGGNTVVMAGYMAKEYLVSLKNLNQDDQNEEPKRESRWSPYLQTLPWERGVNNQEHVLFWEEERLETLLKGSLCYNEAAGLRDEVELAIRVLGPIIAKPIRMARGDEKGSGFRPPWQVMAQGGVQSNQQETPEGLHDAVKGAFVCLLTRSFQDGDGDDEKLVPLLDMLQHSETPNVRHAMRKADGAVEVRARCDIEAEFELWNQYRSEEEESMPYSRFFTRFGFVPGITESIENLLQDKSSIFYPQNAEL